MSNGIGYRYTADGRHFVVADRGRHDTTSVHFSFFYFFGNLLSKNAQLFLFEAIKDKHPMAQPYNILSLIPE